MEARQFLRTHLPTGGELPVEEWERRHRTLTSLLWVSAVALAVFSYLSGYGYRDFHALLHVGALVPLAVAAASNKFSRHLRTLICSVGLLTAAALGVHVAGGVIEAHFSFFVVVTLLTVYEDWVVFALAVGYVLAHHGILGMFAANQVFAQPDQFAHPWRWAAIHALFVAGAGVAGLMTWRLNEDVRRTMRATQEQLRVASRTDVLTELGNRRRLLTDLDEAMKRARYDPVALRPGRVQGLQRRLRPSGRRRAAHPLRTPPPRRGLRRRRRRTGWAATSSASSSPGRTPRARRVPPRSRH